MANDKQQFVQIRNKNSPNEHNKKYKSKYKSN